MFTPHLRWKLRAIAKRLERQLDTWKNLWLGTQITTRMCPSCRALIGISETSCSLCGATLSRRPSGFGKLVANILPHDAPITYSLLTVNFLVFLVIFTSKQNQTLEDISHLLMGSDRRTLIAWGANVGALVAQDQWWRLVSGMFIHIGIIHLLFNSYALMFIGPLLEELLGKERFFVTYVTTGIFGFILSNWYYPVWLTTAGASGAIFGMIGLAVVISKRWGSWGRMLQQQLVHWIIYAFIFGFFIGANNAAHMGGALSGVGLGFVLSNPNRQEESPYKQCFWRILYWGCLAITVTSLIMACHNRFLVQ